MLGVFRILRKKEKVILIRKERKQGIMHTSYIKETNYFVFKNYINYRVRQSHKFTLFIFLSFIISWVKD